MKSATLAAGWLAVLLAPAALADPVPAVRYPRVAMFSWIRGNGVPFSHRGVIDTALVERQAMWDLIIMDPARAGVNAEVQRMIRRYNPSATMLAYSQASTYFVCGPCWAGGRPIYGCDTTTVSYAWSRWRAVRAFDGVLFGRSGPYKSPACGHIDMSRPGLAGALADSFVDRVDRSVWNGFLADELCGSIAWTQHLGDSIDYRRSGFASLAAWDSAYRAGVDRYLRRLRQRAPTMTIVGNCGPRGAPVANGWMHENWPNQPGESVESYLAAEASYTRPTANLLTSWRSSKDQADPENQRRARLVLAVATLGSGAGMLTGSEEDAGRGFLPWWWDEYAVDPQGVAVEDVRYKGWLGKPRGAARRQGLLWRRDFEHGVVLVNPGGQSVTVAPASDLWHIRGVVSPDVNHGGRAESVTLPGHDAVFLCRKRGGG